MNWIDSIPEDGFPNMVVLQEENMYPESSGTYYLPGTTVPIHLIRPNKSKADQKRFICGAKK